MNWWIIAGFIAFCFIGIVSNLYDELILPEDQIKQQARKDFKDGLRLGIRTEVYETEMARLEQENE